MRLKGRQLRFVVASIAGWAVGRIVFAWGSWGWSLLGIGVVTGVALIGAGLRWPQATPPPRFVAARPFSRRAALPASVASPEWRSARFEPAAAWPVPTEPAQLLRLAMGSLYPSAPMAGLRHAIFAAPARRDEAPSPPPPTQIRRDRAPSRWGASAYLFVRQGSGPPSLAANGELGGSQAAARITYRLNADGPVRTALAARLYAPLRGAGAEAAVGLDWYPFAGQPLRLSVERRVGLDHAGRDAWSAYAAGGFYREPVEGLVVDGYAQAGVVGLHRGDAFVDAGLRSGAKIGPAILGAGLWGAAQPGVSRLDAGPRLALALPAGKGNLSLAVEGRFRLAGRADPGSGATLTLAADF